MGASADAGEGTWGKRTTRNKETNSNRSFSFDAIAAILKQKSFWFAKSFSTGLKSSLM